MNYLRILFKNKNHKQNIILPILLAVVLGLNQFAILSFNIPIAQALGNCELTLTKTDFDVTAQPGSNLIYQLKLKNTGTADCTGGGVRLRDYFDLRTSFVDSDTTISYQDSTYIEWNFGTMHPGVEKTVNLTMYVADDVPCDAILLNKTKFWSNETSWGSFVEETTPLECSSNPVCGDGIVNQTSEQCDDGNTTNNDGCNSTCQIEYGTISGCKYKDLNNNGIIDSGEPTISQWPIILTDNIVGAPQALATTTTDVNGCFEFTNLTFNAEYTVAEEQLPGWVQTYPSSTTYTVEIKSTIPYTNNDFANYQTPGVSCGDGVVNQTSEQCDGTASVPTNYTCNDQCQLVCVTNCGGGGGPTNPILTIDKSANVVFTNPGGIVDYTIAVKNIGSYTGLNLKITDILPAGLSYYSTSTGTTTTGVWELGNITINETKTVTYKVKFASNIAAGNYLNTAVATITNGNSAQDDATVEVRLPTVQGYSPLLAIAKNVNMTFTNPGGEIIYTVNITNTHDTEIAKNVILTDRLPTEFYFNDNKSDLHTWILGDIQPHETKTVSFPVTVKSNTKAGNYINYAFARSDNTPEVYDDVPIEVRIVITAGFELPDTDGSLNHILSIILGMLILGAGFIGFQIKKEYKLV